MNGLLTSRRGFTIVELLIVIVVIAILAAISIVAYNGIQTRAKVSKANSDLVTLEKAMKIARINEDKTLIQITGSGCTTCYDQARYELTLDLIGAASGTNLSSLKSGNPWGSKYVIDENEGENGNCYRDTVRVGANVPAEVASSFSIIYLPLHAC
jgi:prepilin-type N-terminal cleavage/methylation domain-containing protein